MECKNENIGVANPDIAGVGIILAFAVLAGLSLVLAGVGYYVALQAVSEHPHNLNDPTPDNEWEARRTRFFRSQRLDVAEKVLGSISEVQLFNGIALLIAAIVQRNSLSLYHLHVVYDTVNFTAVSFTASLFIVWISRKIQKQDGEDEPQNSVRHKLPRMRMIPMMMFLVSSSLWVAIFCILYLVYVVLFSMALGRWNAEKFGYCYRYQGITAPNSPHPEVDQIYLGITCWYMFVLLQSSYTDSHGLYSPPTLSLIEFAKKVGIGQWFVSLQERYKSVQAFYEAQYDSALKPFPAWYSRWFSRWFPKPTRTNIASSSPAKGGFFFLNPQHSLSTRLSVVCIPLGQYLLHLYMVWAIRSANQVHLQGDSEDTWGFGQVVALVQILPVLKRCTESCIDYRMDTAKWLEENPRGLHTRAAAISTNP